MANYIPQVDYTSRDYSAIRADLINNIQNFAPQWTSRDSSDLGIVLLELFAYMGDIMSFYIDRAANESFLSTATQRSSVIALSNMFGYIPDMGAAAYTTLNFTNVLDAVDGDPEANKLWIPPLTKVSTSTVIDGETVTVQFETMNTEPLSVAAASVLADVPAREGKTVTYEELTYAFNGLPNQFFKLSQSPAEIYTMSVFVDNVPYRRVNYLLDADGSDAVYTTAVDSSGNTYVVFGDNIGGRIPPKNAVVYASYRVINGSIGNVAANTLTYITTPYYLDQTGVVEGHGLTVTNPGASYGGTDPESTTSMRVNAPRNLRALNRAVTTSDYASLATQVVGVGKAVADASVYSHIVLYMGLTGAPGVDEVGDPTPAWDEVQSDVVTYFEDKLAPGATISVIPPVMAPIAVSVDVWIDGAHTQASVANNVKSAIADMLSYDMVVMGQRVTLQDLSIAVGSVEGVLYSSVGELYRSDTETSATSPHDVPCAIGEIPYLDLDNFTVTPHGGIGIA